MVSLCNSFASNGREGGADGCRSEANLPPRSGGDKLAAMVRVARSWFFRGLALTWAGAVLLACGAQSENYDDQDWTKDHGLQSGAWREVETLFSAAESDADRYNQTLRGVRHDLTPRSGAEPTTRCTCLDVIIGKPSDPRFAWADTPPALSDKTMALAVRTEGSNCPNGPAKRRPSIQAVEERGGNVTVVIEELGYDRPQALGAVIPKPALEGALYVRAASSKHQRLPYAATVHGNNICRVVTDPNQHHQQIRSGRRF
jgi:hypothetical protein